MKAQFIKLYIRIEQMNPNNLPEHIYRATKITAESENNTVLV